MDVGENVVAIDLSQREGEVLARVTPGCVADCSEDAVLQRQARVSTAFHAGFGAGSVLHEVGDGYQ